MKHKEGTDIVNSEQLEDYQKRFLDAINDDLNMPIAMGIVWEIIRNSQKSKDFANLLIEFDKALGLDLQNAKQYLEKQDKIELPEEIKQLIEQRKQARNDKDWEKSDKIRDELLEKGYTIKDTKDGMYVERK